ncbi:ATP-binding cassette domain-containing protein [Microbacterium horticulturae]|uniref:ATP-binding cassette domain-containing protein n=1 Tax=Microbacterium horticulturae TaxID=3028316 RepID=A0ABY8C012_9MICO|nr:ATP-binding cassette domain-containing protein [Microbacterium sp. KACC 23027]WEG09739.1 ATP-binding cassette domain-containing protein [Microbacterium sp. KACC 23027]
MSGATLEARVTVDRGRYTLQAEVHADAGEVVAVMGPSGAGKSTLFGALAGFVDLDEGFVHLDGRTVDAASGPHVTPRDRGIVLLGQEPRLFPHLTARENIAFGPRARGTVRATARADADVWLERVGLAGMGGRRPAELSGGQQQRVALARALATSPRLLLLDEPLTSLDPETAGGIRELLSAQLRETGTTALVATHDAADAASLASRLVILEDGRVTQTGAVQAVMDAPATPFVTIIAGTRPHRGPAGLQARIVQVDEDEDGLAARARTADGAEVVLRLPIGTAIAPGATITVG